MIFCFCCTFVETQTHKYLSGVFWAALNCEHYFTQQYPLYNLQCTLFTVGCTVHNVHFEEHNRLCTVDGTIQPVHCTENRTILPTFLLFDVGGFQGNIVSLTHYWHFFCISPHIQRIYSQVYIFVQCQSKGHGLSDIQTINLHIQLYVTDIRNWIQNSKIARQTHSEKPYYDILNPEGFKISLLPILFYCCNKGNTKLKIQLPILNGFWLQGVCEQWF